MKADTHPSYEKTLITCACGRVTETRSTVGELHVEICSHCHPFFTGRQKLVDTAGRVERFMAKYGMTDEAEEIAEAAAARAAESERQEMPEDVAKANLAAERAAAEARRAREEEALKEEAPKREAPPSEAPEEEPEETAAGSE